MNIFFGTDGWRAHIDTEINEETVSVVAQAFADFIHQDYKEKSPCVALAYDTRKNSQLFATTFAEVLSGNRIQVLLSDRIAPTPVLSYATLHLNCCAGVMITASHNPPSYNGIKFIAVRRSVLLGRHTKNRAIFICIASSTIYFPHT